MLSAASSPAIAPDMGPHDPVEYEKWFHDKVQASLADPRPSVPHAQVMADMQALVAKTAAEQGK
ncbi:stability determinant [Achromobacter anxifer]|uniref:antitoxin PaaA2 family protein n=1 Tax=Achromobacter anxifer TaxID=1287737 RepID=UPI001C37D919|nr:stability determinant [Achromobacter anxifer]